MRAEAFLPATLPHYGARKERRQGFVKCSTREGTENLEQHSRNQTKNLTQKKKERNSPRNTRNAWSSGAGTTHESVRPCRQRDSPATLCPRRFYALLVFMPPFSLCPPYVIASGAKQSPLPHDPRLLRSARNDTGSARNDTGSARNDTARVFRAAATLAQNAAIERLAKKDARVSCSKNKEMMDSSLSWRLAAPGNG